MEGRNSPIPTSSASKSGSDSLLYGKYEVFLSFCGKDTRYGFTDFLYTYLQGAGVRTFRDDNELRVGEEIGPEILKAIKDSKISIPILSKNYLSSKWCMLELAEIVGCQEKSHGKKKIFPVFYDVEPYDVRNQSGSYEESFRQLEKKKRLDVKSWKEALTKVGQLKGLELKKETGGHEGELVKIIVEKVLQFLKINYLHLPENVVGMHNRIEKLIGLLEIDSNDVRIVGIHGMGGLGKTTIAKVIYNQLCERFEGHCFLDNVRENSKHHNGIVDLQNQLISKIQNLGVLQFSDVNEGRSIIRDVIHRRKLLIVLDDVDKNSQVDMLIGNQNSLGARSRIIITTRDKNVLDAIELTCHRKDADVVYRSYTPEFMDVSDSLQLFSKYAFMRDSPLEGYTHLSKEVVSLAAGLPLVLVVLGSAFLVDRDKDSWEEKLRQLRTIPHEEVLEKLKFSFEALKHDEKQIFLDIACLFIGWDKTIPSYMWDDCGFYPRVGINVLVSRSLITIGDDNKLIMHDQLRDLGRQIVREESLNKLGERSRLWCEEEAMHVLETRQGTSCINALCLPYEKPEDPLVASDFCDLLNLRYLNLRSKDLDGDFKHLLPNLRWLHFRSGRKFNPTNLRLKNLVNLDLSHSDFTDDWEGWSQFKTANKLKVLDLSWCSYVRVLPDLSMFPSLEILKVAECRLLCRLDGLQQLKSLRLLDAACCEELQTLPSLSNLTKLVHLNLAGCSKLIMIQGLDKLKSLQDLNIHSCSSIERLPNVSDLNKLKTFDAFKCDKLIEIEGLHRLDSLEYLDLSCSSLLDVPDLSNLNKCKVLRFYGLTRNFKEIKLLKVFSINNLIMFLHLDGFEFLEKLSIVECSFSERLLDLSHLKRLKIIRISYCEELIEIQDLGGWESLEKLQLSYCSSIKRLPNLSKFIKLKELYFCDVELIEIQGLDRLESLEILRLQFLSSLERLPNLPNFGMLKVLHLESCHKLHEVDGLGVVESLESLTISNCDLEEIPNLRNLKNLKKLSISYLPELTGIYGLSELKPLESLSIHGCLRLRNLPDIQNTGSHIDGLTYLI